MKKLLIIMLLILVLVGCTNQEDDALRIGMDLRFYPFTGMDNEGEPAGVEVDIAYALGAFLGREVEIVNTEFPMLIPALESGDIDVILGSMSITEEREKAVDFSTPYLFDKIVAIMNKDFAETHNITDETPVEELFSIESTRYIGITGSIAVSIPASYGFEVAEVTTEAVAEREIATGTADVLVGAYTLYGMHDVNREHTIMYRNAIVTSETGMAVKEGNVELLNQINAFIDQMEASGLNQQLRNAWNDEIGKKLFDDNMTLDYYLRTN